MKNDDVVAEYLRTETVTPAEPAKKRGKAWKPILITLASLLAVVYGGVALGHKVLFPIQTSAVPTIDSVTDGQLVFGTAAHANHATTLDEFLPVFAQQLVNYNAVAADLWPNNAMVNQSAIIEGLESGRFWFITPEGVVSPISQAEVVNLVPQRSAYAGGFSPYDGGMYIAVTEANVGNFLMWQHRLHVGTFDAIALLIHEGFHLKTQVEGQNWLHNLNDQNSDRNPFMDNMASRIQRDLLRRQLLKAVSEPGNTSLILDAVATYENWKQQFPAEFNAALWADRTEGSARYYEMVGSLFAAYPDQVRSREDADRALALIATRPELYFATGLVQEGYVIGSWAGVLLDRVEPGWQVAFSADRELTPMEMLAQHFAGETLPAPVQLSQAEIDEVTARLNTPPDVNAGLPRTFATYYDLLFPFMRGRG